MSRLLREPELARFAAELVAVLPPRSVLWLSGGLGAGKTTLARAVAAALGAGTEVTSPTFGLVHRYPAPAGAVFHVDCYRLRTPDEAMDIDWGELESGRLLIVEWPARGGAWVPEPSVTVELAPGPDPATRVVTVTRGAPA